MRRFLRRLRAGLTGVGLMVGVGLGAGGGPAFALCAGENLFFQLPEATRAELSARAEAVPFARGLFWRATKGARDLVIVGTYHLDDWRHGEIVQSLLPYVTGASALYVEAGPEEEAALIAKLRDNPDVMFIRQGPSLLERFDPKVWKEIVRAFERRGVMALVGAKFQPWYAATVLAMPPCQLQTASNHAGLDAQLIALAVGQKIPIKGLEPYDTLFTVFEALGEERMIEMIRASVALEDESEDLAVTLAELYFSGDVRLIWELSRHKAFEEEGVDRAKIEAELAAIEAELMVKRNRAWVGKIDALPDVADRVVVAFGALHLAGEEGVLALLNAQGWTVSELSFAP